MAYPAFLNLLSQFAEKGRNAHVFIEDKLLHVKKMPQKNQWLFSLTLVKADRETRSCFLGTGQFCLNGSGIHLRMDAATGMIHAEKQVEMFEKKYIPFRNQLSIFLKEAEDFQQVLIS